MPTGRTTTYKLLESADLNSNPYSVTEIGDVVEDVESTARPRWPTSILVLYVISFAYGSSQVFSFENRTVEIAFTILFSILLTIWAVSDSRRRAKPMVSIVRVLYLLFCPLSTLIYLVRTRGVRGLGWFLLNGVLLYACIYVGFFTTFYLIDLSGYWDLMDQVFFEE